MLIDGSNRGRPKKENEESVYRVREAIRVQNLVRRSLHMEYDWKDN